MLKKCKKCNEVKDSINFGKHKTSKDGLQYSCKKCSAKYNLNWRRSIRGMLIQIYENQKKASKKRNHDCPKYSQEELNNWALSQENFNELYANWVKSGFLKELTPSVDRLNDYKGYSLNNIRLTFWEDNNKKGHNDSFNGKNNKTNKAVIQLSSNGIFINRFYSISKASRDTKVPISSIWNCCNNKCDISGGYKWIYDA